MTEQVETTCRAEDSALQSNIDFSAIKPRTFPAGEAWSAYHDCENWLRSLNCSVGSMQRGSRTAVFFEHDAHVSKNRNLGIDILNVHGWICPGANGRFRDCDIEFKVTKMGKELIASAQGQIEEPPSCGDTDSSQNSGAA